MRLKFMPSLTRSKKKSPKLSSKFRNTLRCAAFGSFVGTASGSEHNEPGLFGHPAHIVGFVGISGPTPGLVQDRLNGYVTRPLRHVKQQINDCHLAWANMDMRS